VTRVEEERAVASYKRVLHCVSCVSSISKSAPSYKAHCPERGKLLTAIRRTRLILQRRGMFSLSDYGSWSRVPGTR
jgi:predicted RNA-binding Zn-ribbon protein involved in translation (DUF1610 family)